MMTMIYAVKWCNKTIASYDERKQQLCFIMNEIEGK